MYIYIYRSFVESARIAVHEWLVSQVGNMFSKNKFSCFNFCGELLMAEPRPQGSQGSRKPIWDWCWRCTHIDGWWVASPVISVVSLVLLVANQINMVKLRITCSNKYRSCKLYMSCMQYPIHIPVFQHVWWSNPCDGVFHG